MFALDQVYAAAMNLATGLAGAGAAWFALRKRYSTDTTEIRKDRGEWEWIQAAIAERERALQEVAEARDERTADVQTIARLEARLEAFEGRATAYGEERERQHGACEERVRSVSEELLASKLELRDQKLANSRLFLELVKHDRALAERLMLEYHLRGGPWGTPAPSQPSETAAP